MAKATVDVFGDDLDGSEGAETVRLGWNGDWRELELEEEPGHAVQGARQVLERKWASLRGWAIEPSAPPEQADVARSAKSKAKRDPKLIRAWATDNGISVPDEVRIPSEVERQYNEASGRPSRGAAMFSAPPAARPQADWTATDAWTRVLAHTVKKELVVRTAITRAVGSLVLVVSVTGIVFVTGMRTKSPAVVNGVRKLGRAMRPLAIKSAGGPGASASVVHHVGRTSGRSYSTPVGAVPIDDGFVIALPYGLSADWLKTCSRWVRHDRA